MFSAETAERDLLVCGTYGGPDPSQGWLPEQYRNEWTNVEGFAQIHIG